MCFTKKLILSMTGFSILFGDGISFRGKSKEQMIGKSIPMAFTNIIANNYNILPSQIHPQRGSYLIIVPDGIMDYLTDFVSFKNSQGFDVYVLPLSETGESADAIKTTITNKFSISI